MLGASENPSLHAKAAESYGLLLFVRHLLSEHLADFEERADRAMCDKAKHLCEASKAAVRFEETFAKPIRHVSRREAEQALGSYKRFLRFYSQAGLNLLPKCHLMFHLIQRCLSKGNPKRYSTYRDESFNGVVARIARSSHRRTWMNVIHWKCQSVHMKSHERVRKSELFAKVFKSKRCACWCSKPISAQELN